MFGEVPAIKSEQARLAAELVENEKQLEAMGGGDSILETELECLMAVLNNPQGHLRFEPRRLRLDTMNMVLDDNATDQDARVDFSVAELNGTPPLTRAFVLARVARTELPPPKTINFGDAARLL